MAWFYIRDGQRNEWGLNERLPAGADLFHVDFLNQFVWAAAERAHMSHRIPLTKDNLLTRNMGGMDLLECEVKSLADPTLDSSLGIISIGDDIQSTATLGRWLDAIYLADGIADGSLDRQWADIDARPAKPQHGDIIDSIFFDNVRDYLININDAAYVFRIERASAWKDYAHTGLEYDEELSELLKQEAEGDTFTIGAHFTSDFFIMGWRADEEDHRPLVPLGNTWDPTPEQYAVAWGLVQFKAYQADESYYLANGNTWFLPIDPLFVLQFGLIIYCNIVPINHGSFENPQFWLEASEKYGYGGKIEPEDVRIPLRVGELKSNRLRRDWSGRCETWYETYGIEYGFPGWQWDGVGQKNDLGKPVPPPPGDSRLKSTHVLWRADSVSNRAGLSYHDVFPWGGIGKNDYYNALYSGGDRPPLTYPSVGRMSYVRHAGSETTIYLVIEPQFKYPSLPKGV